jgi:UDP-N-acetylglucosamine acyltransferase
MAMVGGMSRISRDVPPYMTVEGNPARVRSLNLIGLKRRGVPIEEIQQLKKAFRLLYLQHVPFKDAIAELNMLSNSQYIQYLREFIQCSLADNRRGLITSKR